MIRHSSSSQTDSGAANLQGFPHLMLQEIWEQPDVAQTCLETYIPAQPQGATSLSALGSALNLPSHLVANLSQIHILACGTSRHAGLIAQYWFEQIAAVPTRVRSASEFVVAPLPLTPDTLTIAITQSGETADTLAAVKHQKDAYAHWVTPSRLLGITNHPDSSLVNLVDDTLPTLAGTEVGVAATKTFTTQLMVLACLMLEIAYHHQPIRDEWLEQILLALRSLPQQMETILLQQEESIQHIAQTLAPARHCILLGQGISRAIALEGALKLKETTYIHAEGYATGEFRHGPIALLDETVPVIAIVPGDSVNEQLITTLQKVKSHNVPLIGITTGTVDPVLLPIWDQLIPLPAIDGLLSPFLTVIPLQLLAYHIAVQKGLNVDRPRNITKTVT